MDYTSQPKETTKMGELKNKMIDLSTAILQKKYEIQTMRDQRTALEKELQIECDENGHNFINETEGGPYGETYTYCSICNLLR